MKKTKAKPSPAPERPDVEFGINWRDKAALEAAAGKPLPNTPDKVPFIPLIQRHQFCAFHNAGNGAFYHRKERIKLLWPDYQWHRWNERRLQGFCDYDWLTWMGPSSAAKTTDAAVFGLEYWNEAPNKTAVIFCSTTIKMLRMRIWSQVARHHTKLPKNLGNVGELLDSVTRIRWQQGDDVNGVFGMAVEEGSVEEVVNNLIGVHTERVLLILDEMQGIREAIMRATNNMVANPQFKMIGMGNPDSFQNPLVKESEPVEGWDSIVRGETEQWETHGGPTKGRGLCQFFDGRKSPADDSPEEAKRLPWLCNREWYEGIVKAAKGNENDPRVWQFGIGFPPPTGLESTLLDDAIINSFHCKDKAVWTEGFIACAFLDPARTGGDKRMLQFGRRGQTAEPGIQFNAPGKTIWVIEGTESINVPLDANNLDRTIDFQILDFVKAECQKRGISPSEFSLFSTGAGGPLLSIFREHWSPMIEGIEEGGSASDRILDDTGKSAKESYDNRASELQFNVREFAVANGIRGLSHEAAFQFCNRRTFYRGGKWCIEPKVGSKGRTDERGRSVKGFRERLGKSPDDADAFAGLVAHCMARGAVPSLLGEATVANEHNYQQGDDEFSSENYLRGYDYSHAM